VTAVGALGG
jgi:hypothetical protein